MGRFFCATKLTSRPKEENNLAASPECVLCPARAVLVAAESVQAGWAETVLAAGPLETLVAQTRPVDVVALAAVLTVALVGALWAVGSHRTLLLTPGGGDRDATATTI